MQTDQQQPSPFGRHYWRLMGTFGCEEMKTAGYAFVLSLVEPQVDVPYEIIRRHFLQKATPEQTEKIKSLLNMFKSTPSCLLPYEYEVIETEDDEPGHRSFSHKHLDPKQWRYWIIFFEGTNAELQELGFALSLMEHEIELGFWLAMIPSLGAGFGWHSQHVHTYLNDQNWQEVSPKPISAQDLQLASRCYDKLKSLPNEYEHITRAFRRFHELRSIPLSSELTVIGLFSVLESILTHAPKTTEGSDSLVHQIKHKIPLVRKRFVRQLDHRRWFGEMQERNLWPKLYAYRSKIVHGEKAAVTGKLGPLKDRKTVVDFLRQVMKLLLIEALEEPVLMTDLKEC
jgi:hypothetical protein